jgi:hypothetical protein
MRHLSWSNEPGLSASPRLDPAFARLMERCVLAPARSIGEELPVIAVTEPPAPVTVWHPPQGNTWIAARHDADPMTLGRGAMYAPKREIGRMKRMGRAGVTFDVVLVGHEIPGRWYPGDPVPKAYEAGSPAAVDRVVATQRAVFDVASGLLRAAARGAGVATAGVLQAMVSVDPLVLGGLRDPHSGQIAWVYLSGWYEDIAS